MNEPAPSPGQSVVAKSSAAPVCPDPVSKLLPSLAYSPFQILLWAVVPLLCLLWCNYGSYQTIVGDIDSGARWKWILSFWGSVALIFGFCMVVLVLWRTKKRVSLPIAVVSFVPIVAFINYAVWQLPGTVPRAAQWIINPESIVIQNLTGIMPAILYFGAIICGGRGRSVASEIGKALAGLLIVGAIVGLSMWIGGELGFEVLAVVLMSLAILVCTFAVLRLVIVAGNAMFRMSPLALTLVGLWVGLLMPVIGLWVNFFVPFPYDFQVPWIYAFAIVNGVLLSMPLPAKPMARRLVWFAQCAGLPFSIYFFLVFMPFMPLSVPGLAIFGGGLLVLVPACVLVLHGFRVVDGYRKQRSAVDSRAAGTLVWATGAAAFAIVPGAVWWNAGSDRSVLHGALDYVYESSPHSNPRFDGDPAAIGRALTHVEEFKSGKRLPMLSAFYNDVVFDGLTLPDTKIKKLSKMFLGEKIETKKERNLWSRNRGFGNQRFRMGNPPQTDVTLLPVTASYRPDSDGFVRTTAMLKMRNNQSSQGEFEANLTLPKNAAVSGFWLHIENERVPGRMTEKKSAMWVYQMIRDVTRRDPGILRYTSPEQLELRVFPLAGHEVRTVEIEFLAPVAIDQPFAIRGQRIALTDGSSQAAAGVCVASSDTGASVAVAAKSFSKALPSIDRKPLLHFIVDWSRSANISAASFKAAIDSASAAIPNATLGMASLVNFELCTISGAPLPLSNLPAALESARDRLPQRGGFNAGRAMHSILVENARQFQVAQPEDLAFDYYPVIVIVGAPNGLDLGSEDLAWLGQLCPDAPDYYTLDASGRELNAKGFESGAITGGRSHSVHLFRLGSQNLVARANGASVAHLHGEVPASELSIFDNKRDQFIPVADVRQLPEDVPYAQALNLWRQQQLSIEDPSAVGAGSLRELVSLSRGSGILTNATAYIAVESHAQWKMLEEAEKKKLKAGKAFELGETPSADSVPEPSTGMLVLLAGLVLVFRRRR